MNTTQHENPRKQSSSFWLIKLFSSSLEHFLLLLIVLTIVSSLMMVFHPYFITVIKRRKKSVVLHLNMFKHSLETFIQIRFYNRLLVNAVLIVLKIFSYANAHVKCCECDHLRCLQRQQVHALSFDHSTRYYGYFYGFNDYGFNDLVRHSGF